ncbi:unnamed protein product [Taenia asiatica]|uniref:Uncharacterized protein n=1 Tax=Taenia asiatica TaxID=60517 RepID=A0A0R3VV95_TAEAS|nr:unnamed protein product [Taenia asiatica]
MEEDTVKLAQCLQCISTNAMLTGVNRSQGRQGERRAQHCADSGRAAIREPYRLTGMKREEGSFFTPPIPILLVSFQSPLHYYTIHHMDVRTTFEC